MPTPTTTSLRNAVQAAIAHGNALSDIKPQRWSETYGNCGTEAIIAMWETVTTEMSRQPVGYEGEGK